MTTKTVQLISAIFADDPSKIKFLVEQGMDVTDRGFFNIPPLLRAVLYGKPKALQALLDGGANKNIKDGQGRTALEIAQKYNHSEIVEILLRNEKGRGFLGREDFKT